MMDYMATEIFDIDSMPRGGPDASWLDRRLQTDRLEYLDRDDVDHLKRRVVRSLDRTGRIFGRHKKFARITLDKVADVLDPKILELGSGHGGLSDALLKMHPTAHVTVTDIEPTSVAAIAAGDLGSHPRAVVREMDATAIDAPDGHYDLAVFAGSFHHLPPPLATRVFAEGRHPRRRQTADHRLAAPAVITAHPGVGVDAAVGDGVSGHARRVHQLAAYLQPVGAAGIGQVRRPGNHP
jgi:SAM-dependent methyltransferase